MSIGPEKALEMENLYRALEAASKAVEEQEPAEEGPRSETEELVSKEGVRAEGETSSK